jgi:hypothetical protein
MDIGNWNISSNSGKEPKLVREAQKYRLDIVGVSSTGLRGAGTRDLDQGKTEIDERIWRASAVSRELYRCVVTKQELSRKAKLSVFKLVNVLTITYSHESRVVTERLRSRAQAVEIRFFRRIARLSRLDRVRNATIRELLSVEPLLLRIEISQLQ